MQTDKRQDDKRKHGKTEEAYCISHFHNVTELYKYLSLTCIFCFSPEGQIAPFTTLLQERLYSSTTPLLSSQRDNDDDDDEEEDDDDDTL